MTRCTPLCWGLRCTLRCSQALGPTIRPDPCWEPWPEPLLWFAEHAMGEEVVGGGGGRYQVVGAVREPHPGRGRGAGQEACQPTQLIWHLGSKISKNALVQFVAARSANEKLVTEWYYQLWPLAWCCELLSLFCQSRLISVILCGILCHAAGIELKTYIAKLGDAIIRGRVTGTAKLFVEVKHGNKLGLSWAKLSSAQTGTGT